MTSLRENAPAKINLCLFLGGIRSDGRHELVTLFESVSLEDELVLAVADGGADEVVCPGLEGPNLVADALRGLRARGWDGPPVRIEITKRIPVAAGMAGGSADAAAALRVARALGSVSDAALAALARELGADVPAQLTPGLVLGTGAGDVVEPRPPLASHALVIVPLPERLSTASVYAEADRLGLPRSELGGAQGELEAALKAGARLPDALIVNDLEPATRSLCPAVDGALDAVRAAGADNALVCGSGPTVAGVFWGSAGQERSEAAAEALRGQFRGACAAVAVSSRASGTMGAG